MRRNQLNLIALSVALLLCSSAPATDVTILEATNGRVRQGGTAFRVGMDGERDYYLSAGHTFRGMDRARIGRGGQWHDVDILAVSSSPDLAVVSLPTDGRPPFRLASELPQPGREVTLKGFSGGKPRTARGAVTRMDPQNGQVLTAIPAYPGDSGGPLIVSTDVVFGMVVEFVPQSTNGRPGMQCGPRGCQPVSVGSRAVSSVTIHNWLRDKCPQALGKGRRIEPEPEPAAPAPSPVIAGGDDDLRQSLAEILRRMDSGEFRGPAGEKGDRGEPGPVGPEGPRGERGVAGEPVDPEAVEQLVVTILQGNLSELKRRIAELESRSPADGKPGAPGTVTVVIRDNGKEIHRAEHVPAGKTLIVPIERTEQVR